MGICSSKKSTAVVTPYIPEAKSLNGDSVLDKFAATSFIGLKTKGRESKGLLSAPIIILGRHERTLRARQFLPYDSHTMQKPTVTTGQPWTDEAFPHVFEKDKEGKTIKLSWKRPKDFASNVRLFGDTLNRYCAKQGQVSDCFFISTLSAIAEHPEYIKQILPVDAYETDPSKYTGIVHCRFWWMGEWIDVYTDDVLPCSEDLDQYVGAHSDDKNIVWAPLAEKALARLYGSYPKIAGNQMEVFRLLTGGIVEEFNTSKAKEDNNNFLPPDKLFERAEKALNSGSTVMTGISEDVPASQLKGLVSNHAYSVTAVLKIKHKTQVAKLLKIRNPWGEKGTSGRVSDGEWKGRWSYTSTEWKEVDEPLRKQHNVNFNKGGEFWVCMEDFFKHFENLYIGNMIPNFDRDGFRKEDGLDKVINILGEWHGVTLAGNEEKNKMRNPRFILTIPGQSNSKPMPVVIEITRQFQNPANSKDDKDTFLCAIDIHMIDEEDVRGNRLWMSLTKQTADESHIGCRTMIYLFKLFPGDHLLVPYYYDSQVKTPISRSFCIRIFTNTNVMCSQMNAYPIAFYGDWNHPFGENFDAARILTLFGEWRGETAAGNKRNKMRNPKFILNVPDIRSSGQHVTIILHLRCNRDVIRIPNSDIDIFKIEKDQIVEKRLWRSMQQIPKKEESRFVANDLFRYDLIPGNYLLLPFFYDEEQLSCQFCIRMLASSQVQCSPTNEYPIAFYGNWDHPFGNNNDAACILTLFGEWRGESAAGHTAAKMKNPKFILNIPDIHGAEEQATILLHLRCNQDVRNIPNSDIDVFKIEKDQIIEKRLWRSMEQIPKKEESRFEANYLFKYDLIPGNYLLLPLCYDEEPIACQFCIRILATSQVKCSPTNEHPIAFYGNWDHPFGNNYDAACILTLFGEWRGESAAGHTKAKMKNPKFILNIPDIHGAEEQTTIFLHLRCNQDVRNIPNSDIDVFKIEKDQVVEKRVWRLMQHIPKKKESRSHGNYLFKYELMPGNYLILPFFYDEESLECEFCIRVLASSQVQCRPQADNPVMFVRKAENRLEYKNQSLNLDKVVVVFGEWVNNLTAGGQISHNSFIRNPQYGLSIAGNAPQPVLIDLLQETEEPIHAVGCHVIQIDEDQDLPVGRDVLHNNARVKTLDGKTHPFMRYSEASGQYLLPPGRYLVLVYADKPTDEKKFALVIAAQAQSKIRLTEPK